MSPPGMRDALQESGSLRAVAFSLFGELGGRIGTQCEEYRDQLQANLVSLLLHLNDEDDEVRKVRFFHREVPGCGRGEELNSFVRDTVCPDLTLDIFRRVALHCRRLPRC